MKIKIDKCHYAHICDSLLGVQGESGTRIAEVNQPEIVGATSYALRMLTGNAEDGTPICFDMPITDGECKIDRAALVRSGTYQMQWIATNGGDIVAKSQVFFAVVTPSLEDAGAIPSYDEIVSKLDEFNEYVRVVTAEQAKLEKLIEEYGVYPGVSADAGNILQNRGSGLYVPNGGGGGGGSVVTISTTLNDGIEIAKITIDGTEYTLFAPNFTDVLLALGGRVSALETEIMGVNSVLNEIV